MLVIGQLASSNWRLKFGRRNLDVGAVDPTGSYCAMPDDWIKKKLAEAAVIPSKDALFKSKTIFLGMLLLSLLKVHRKELAVFYSV